MRATVARAIRWAAIQDVDLSPEDLERLAATLREASGRDSGLVRG